MAFSDYNSETAFQIYCADWLRKQHVLTKHWGFSFWHHSANERGGGKAGFKAKMMGQSKGFPDFVHCGLKLAVELKVPGGVPTPEQENWLLHFQTIGWTSELVFSADRFKELVLYKIEQATQKGTH